MDHDTAKDYILNKTNTKKIYFSEQELIDAINKWIDEKSYRKYYPANKIESEFSGLYLEALKKRAQPFIDQGLLELKLNSFSSGNLVTTNKGKFLADGIASDLFRV